MTVYKYLGYGETNENGVAKLEYNSEGQKIDHSYTGVGAGEIDYIASLDNPIVDGSIVSEPYTVEDCFYVDDGSDSSKLSKYVVYTSDGNTLAYSNGALLFTRGTGQGYFLIDTNNANWKLSDFVGKTITLKGDINPSTSATVGIEYQDGGTWTRKNTNISSATSYSDSQSIPSTATRVILRFTCGTASGNTCVLDNLRFYFG